MSVYVKGMEMPSQCYDCYIVANDYNKSSLYCKALDEDVENWNSRLPNCPLVEVPKPHGRLVDADFEEQYYASITINPTPDVTQQDYMHSRYVAKAFQMAKTIIEAENE